MKKRLLLSACLYICNLVCMYLGVQDEYLMRMRYYLLLKGDVRWAVA